MECADCSGVAGFGQGHCVCTTVSDLYWLCIQTVADCMWVWQQHLRQRLPCLQPASIQPSSRVAAGHQAVVGVGRCPLEVEECPASREGTCARQTRGTSACPMSTCRPWPQQSTAAHSAAHGGHLQGAKPTHTLTCACTRVYIHTMAVTTLIA